MSYLLEALRKSEARKHRGAMPDIHSTPVPSGRPLGRRWPLVLVVLLLPLLLLLAWQGLRSLGGREGQGAIQDPVLPAANLLPAHQVDTPSQATVTANPAPQQRRQPDGQPRLDARRTPVEGLSQQEPLIESGSDPEAVETTELPAAVRQAEPEPQAQSVPGPEPSAPAPAEAEAQYHAPSLPAPIQFWELPGPVREELPELRISVLVYADRPQDRFVLMGGRRWVEGDALRPGLVLEEIARDGAIFSYRLYRFRVTQ